MVLMLLIPDEMRFDLGQETEKYKCAEAIERMQAQPLISRHKFFRRNRKKYSSETGGYLEPSFLRIRVWRVLRRIVRIFKRNNGFFKNGAIC